MNLIFRGGLIFLSLCFIFGAVPTRAAAADLEISVKIEGIKDDGRRSTLRQMSSLARGTAQYTSIAPVRRAANKDAQILQSALRAQGFYAATVTPSVDREGLTVSVVFSVDRGALFTINQYEIQYADSQSDTRPTRMEDAGIATDGNPRGERLREIQQQLVTHLAETGYPEAKPVSRQVMANFTTRNASAVYRVETGPKATFGDIQVSGLEKTDPSYLNRLRPFEKGALVKRSQLDRYRQRIADTGLFREVSVEAGPVGPDGAAPILVTVVERKRRTVGAGLSFSTDVGIGAEAFWENRNWRGHGETLAARLEYSLPRQSGELTYTDPLPLLPGTWRLSLLLENEDTDAFEAQTVTAGAGVDKRWLEGKLTTSADLRYQYSTITDNDGVEQTFSSASLPLSAVFNNENDRLNPTRGHRARAVVTPFFGDTPFVQSELGGATRYAFGDRDKVVVAMRALFGSTFGTDLASLPSTERYFAGGGGSVRGYAFQEVGPLDDEGDPIGGSSLAEINTEIRYSITDTIQIAAFVDAGNVYSQNTPEFSEGLLKGAGVGARYLTPVGPVRLDVATPLDRRTITRPAVDDMGDPVFNEDGSRQIDTVFEDDIIHVYIAIGQAF